MIIGLISDTHGSVKSFERVMAGPFKQADLILHAGDVLHRGAQSAFSERLSGNGLANAINDLTVPLMISKGNCDSDYDQRLLNVPILSPYVIVYAEGRRLMVLHGDGKNEGGLEAMVRRFRLDLLLLGHSHIARISRVDHALIVNPGTPTIPNPSSPFGKTVGTFDTSRGTIRIHDIDTGNIVIESFLE